jgi:hypothetical protein
MARAEALKEIGGYREAFRLAQDYDLWLRLAEKHRLANLPDTCYQMQFSARRASVARSDEQDDYAALARQLAAERAAHGSEQTDLDTAAAAIAARHTHLDPLTRRAKRAANYVAWAERLLGWGGPAASYAWPMWSYAVTTWPFSLRVWQFALRALRG